MSDRSTVVIPAKLRADAMRLGINISEVARNALIAEIEARRKKPIREFKRPWEEVR